MPKEVVIGGLIAVVLMLVIAFCVGHVIARGAKPETLAIQPLPDGVNPARDSAPAGDAASGRRSFWTLRVMSGLDEATAKWYVNVLCANKFDAFSSPLPPDNTFSVYVGRFAEQNHADLAKLKTDFPGIKLQGGRRPFKDCRVVRLTEQANNQERR